MKKVEKEGVQRIILVLLMLTLLFSILSIAIDFFINNSNIFNGSKQYLEQTNARHSSNSGNIQLIVEKNTEPAGRTK